MDEGMRDSTEMIKRKALEFSLGLMDVSTRENGLMESNMEWGFTQHQRGR
jgi:hypothetical protein